MRFNGSLATGRAGPTNEFRVGEMSGEGRCPSFPATGRSPNTPPTSATASHVPCPDRKGKGLRLCVHDRGAFMIEDEIDPDKNPVIKKIDDEVNDEIKRDEDAVEQLEKRAREAQRKLDAGSRWPEP